MRPHCMSECSLNLYYKCAYPFPPGKNFFPAEAQRTLRENPWTLIFTDSH